MYEQQIAELILNKSVKEGLMRELGNVIDPREYPFGIGFIPTEHYEIDHKLRAKPYTPKGDYLIEGNINSFEVTIPRGVLRITSMLRPKKSALRKYFLLLKALDVVKVYFQPFYNPLSPQNLSLFQTPPQGGGVIIRIGYVQRADVPRDPEAKEED